jgi:hypothetical protein
MKKSLWSFLVGFFSFLGFASAYYCVKFADRNYNCDGDIAIISAMLFIFGSCGLVAWDINKGNLS